MEQKMETVFQQGLVGIVLSERVPCLRGGTRGSFSIQGLKNAHWGPPESRYYIVPTYLWDLQVHHTSRIFSYSCRSCLDSMFPGGRDAADVSTWKLFVFLCVRILGFTVCKGGGVECSR